MALHRLPGCQSMKRPVLVLLLHLANLSKAIFVNYGIYVESTFEGREDYVELGEIWVRNTAAAEEFEERLGEMISGFLMNDVRVLEQEDVYTIDAVIKASKSLSRTSTVYELDGEIQEMANYLTVMIGAYQKGLKKADIMLRTYNPIPKWYRKNPILLNEGTKIRLSYTRAVVETDTFRVIREYSTNSDKDLAVHDGYMLMTDRDSLGNNIKPKSVCDHCTIS